MIRESFRLDQENLKGLDFVVILRCNIFEQKSNESLNELLQRQWREVVFRWKKSQQSKE